MVKKRRKAFFEKQLEKTQEAVEELRAENRKPWYKKREVMIPLLIGVVLALIGLIVAFSPVNVAPEDLETINQAFKGTVDVSLQENEYGVFNKSEIVRQVTNYTPEEINEFVADAKNGARENFSQGLQKYLEGDSAAAIQAFNRSLKYGDQRREAYFFIGGIHAEQKNYSGAIPYYDLSLQEDPSFIFALDAKGQALGSMGKYDESLVEFDKAIALEKDCFVCWYDKGYSLVRLDRMDEALGAFNHSVSIYPGFPDAWVNRGNVLFNRGNIPDAFQSYEKALSINSQSLAGLYNYGRALRIVGEWNLSQRTLEEAHRLYPDNDDVARELSINIALRLTEECKVLADQGLQDDALAKCDEAISENELVPNAWNDKCILLSMKGDHSGAIASCKRALQLVPNSALFWGNMGNAYYSAGMINESIQAYEKSLAIEYIPVIEQNLLQTLQVASEYSR